MSEELGRLIQNAVAVKQQYLDKLLTMPNVVGIGIGYKVSAGVVMNELAITINVSKKVPTAQLASHLRLPDCASRRGCTTFRATEPLPCRLPAQSRPPGPRNPTG